MLFSKEKGKRGTKSYDKLDVIKRTFYLVEVKRCIYLGPPRRYSDLILRCWKYHFSLLYDVVMLPKMKE